MLKLLLATHEGEYEVTHWILRFCFNVLSRGLSSSILTSSFLFRDAHISLIETDLKFYLVEPV